MEAKQHQKRASTLSSMEVKSTGPVSQNDGLSELQGKQKPPFKLWFDWLDLAMFLYVCVSVCAIPHTKIEEIFQVNNIYDHLFFKDNIPRYDFIIYDGVVYRTFLSSLMISTLVTPFRTLVSDYGWPPYYMLIISKYSNFRSINLFACAQHY